MRRRSITTIRELFVVTVLGPGACAVWRGGNKFICVDCVAVREIDDYIASWSPADTCCGRTTMGIQRACDCGKRINLAVRPTYAVLADYDVGSDELCARCSTRVGAHVAGGIRLSRAYSLGTWKQYRSNVNCLPTGTAQSRLS